MNKLNKKFFVLAILFYSILFVSALEIDFQTATLYKKDISAKTAYEMQQEGVIVIDVRTKSEFSEARPKGAVNIPVFYNKDSKRVFNKKFLDQINEQVQKDPSKKIILICRSGARTKLASNLLAYNGFTNVYNVKKGFKYDWLIEDLPIEN